MEFRLSGHPDRHSSLRSLALRLSDGYEDQEVVVNLDEAVILGHAALEFSLPGHPNRNISLYNLGCYLRARFLELAAMCGLDEAIELH